MTKNLNLFLALLALPSASVYAATCNPNGICRACSTCSSCGHCSGGGGTCSVCARNHFEAPSTAVAPPAPSSVSPPSSPPASPLYVPPPTDYTPPVEISREAANRAITQSRSVVEPEDLAPWTGKCVAVTDGDTIQVLRDRRPVKIRFYGIDAPEKRQPYGQQSKNFLSKSAFGYDVKVFPTGIDKYNRVLGWVFVGDKCLNRELISQGLAWHYVQYAPNEAKLAALQSAAVAMQAGLWKSDAVAPWNWRRGQRTPNYEIKWVPITPTSAPATAAPTKAMPGLESARAHRKQMEIDEEQSQQDFAQYGRQVMFVLAPMALGVAALMLRKKKRQP